MLKKLNQLKELLSSQKRTIEEKIQALEGEKVSLQGKIQNEYDKQVEAELAGRNYDDAALTHFNTELSKVEGRLEAYYRQHAKNTASEQDKQGVLEEAAAAFREHIIKNQTRHIREFELDLQIRELIKEAEALTEDKSDYAIYQSIKNSGLFPEIEERELRSMLLDLAAIQDDPEWKSNEVKIEEFKVKRREVLPIWYKLK